MSALRTPYGDILTGLRRNAKPVEVAGDGSCLYYAVLVSLGMVFPSAVKEQPIADMALAQVESLRQGVADVLSDPARNVVLLSIFANALWDEESAQVVASEAVADALNMAEYQETVHVRALAMSMGRDIVVISKARGAIDYRGLVQVFTKTCDCFPIGAGLVREDAAMVTEPMDIYRWSDFPESRWWTRLTHAERTAVVVITHNGVNHFEGTAPLSGVARAHIPSGVPHTPPHRASRPVSAAGSPDDLQELRSVEGQRRIHFALPAVLQSVPPWVTRATSDCGHKLEFLERAARSVDVPGDGHCLYHAAGVTLGAVDREDFGTQRGVANPRALAQVRIWRYGVVTVMTDPARSSVMRRETLQDRSRAGEDMLRREWARRIERAGTGTYASPGEDPTRGAWQGPEHIRALAVHLERDIILLYDEADALMDRRGLVYVYRADCYHQGRPFEGDPAFSQYAALCYPADVYAWEHFPDCEWWSSLTPEGRGKVLVITYNGINHYRGTVLAASTDEESEAVRSPVAHSTPVARADSQGLQTPCSPMLVSPASPVTISPVAALARFRGVPRRRLHYI